MSEPNWDHCFGRGLVALGDDSRKHLYEVRGSNPSNTTSRKSFSKLVVVVIGEFTIGDLSFCPRSPRTFNVLILHDYSC